MVLDDTTVDSMKQATVVENLRIGLFIVRKVKAYGNVYEGDLRNVPLVLSRTLLDEEFIVFVANIYELLLVIFCTYSSCFLYSDQSCS